MKIKYLVYLFGSKDVGDFVSKLRKVLLELEVGKEESTNRSGKNRQKDTFLIHEKSDFINVRKPYPEPEAL